MYNFNLYNPTKIFFGKERLEEIDKTIPKDAKVLLTFGSGSARKSGLLDKVKSALGNRKIYEFGGIEANPRYETLKNAFEIIRSEKIDFLLAVGGGSVIDGTKFLSFAANYEGDPLDLLKNGLMPISSDIFNKIIPYGAILTLPASGSEMNPNGVISYQHGKFPVLTQFAYPVFSVLDPTYTYTLPKTQVANGIVDAFIHTVEQYITYPVDARIQDRFAEGILLTLIEIAKTTIDEPENYDARANLVWSATMALNGMVGSGVPQDWTTHMIGHELTAKFGIDHGQTLAIIYPSLLEVRKEQKRAKLLQYAERVWQINSGSDDEKIYLAIKKTREFFESIGVKTHLSQYGIKSESIPEIIEQLKAHNMTALSETQDISMDISRIILENAM